MEQGTLVVVLDAVVETGALGDNKTGVTETETEAGRVEEEAEVTIKQSGKEAPTMRGSNGTVHRKGFFCCLTGSLFKHQSILYSYFIHRFQWKNDVLYFFPC